MQVKIITLHEAKILGLLRYFSGTPCKNGHISERRVSSRQCLKCASDNAKKFSKENPEKVKLRKANYRRNNATKIAEAKRVYNAKNRERNKIAEKLYWENNKDKKRVKDLKYKVKNRDKVLECLRLYRVNNRDVGNAHSAKRRASKLLRTPKWFSELDEFVWKEANSLARLRKQVTGLDWHVDHMEPLRGIFVSGLHTWNNCQVIPKALNLIKKNKRIFTNSLEWLRAA